MKQVSKLGIMVFAVASMATAIVAAGCSAAPMSTEASTSGIRAAEEVGADKVPRAALHLQLAKEELEAAKSLEANGEAEKAASMLTRSEADAELAVALSRESVEKTEAQAALERVRQLRSGNKQAPDAKTQPVL